MSFVQECIEENLDIWQRCLGSDFIVQLGQNKLPASCLIGYIVDDSLYLWEYARVFAWGILHAKHPNQMQFFHRCISFLQEGEGATRVRYLKQFGLDDEQVEKLPQRAENHAYTEYMLAAAQQGAPEAIMASLPCALSYEWIFRRLVEDRPEVLQGRYADLIQDYLSESFVRACQEMAEMADELYEGLSEERRAYGREIFRACSELELDFWKMSAAPREDLGCKFEDRLTSS